MSTITRSATFRSEPVDLQNGDQMTREEFHRLYEQAPKHFKAELVGGMVHVASPLRRLHANRHPQLGMLLTAYELSTSGVEMGDNATVILGDDSEPQPDLFLRILPEFGGQSSTSKDDYVLGAPELIAEVAHSSKSIDLYRKREDYARNGVKEYLVWSIGDERIHWFDLAAGDEIPMDADRVLRIRSFPGLWIDQEALFTRNLSQMMGTLQQGIASPGHAAFVERLSRSRKP
jgi:Uma2 family endonuclease